MTPRFRKNLLLLLGLGLGALVYLALATDVFRIGGPAERARRQAAAARDNAVGLLAAGRVEEARQTLEASLRIAPNDPATHEALADLLMRGDGESARDAARVHYEAALKADPERPTAARSLAMILLERGEPTQAAPLLELAARAAPRDATLHLQVANLLTELRRYDAAGPYFNRATALAPDAAAYCAWGMMLIETDRGKAAEQVLRQAIELDPDNASYYMHLGRALRQQGELNAAMKAFETAIDKDKQYAPVYFELAGTLLSLKNEIAAERFLRHALTVDRAHVPARVALARLLMTASDPAQRNAWEAASLLRQAVADTQGRDVSLLVALAEVLNSLELPDQALETIEQALSPSIAAGLNLVQREMLLRHRQQYRIALLPPRQGGNDFMLLAVEGMPQDDPADRPWPDPRQPSVRLLVELPLDVTRPPVRGTALDPEIHMRAHRTGAAAQIGYP